MPLDNCPKCGAESTNGLCPRCMVNLVIEGASPGLGEPGETIDMPKPGSVLDTIDSTTGHVPRVVLRDTVDGDSPPPINRPPNDEEMSTRYQIEGEIARGGMGAILKGRDPDLGRDVAIKVLREDLRDNDALVRRFVEEAQIGGQLQHPGVVPIYELGTFTDLRPYFSMKLVKGQTLAELLNIRPAPTDDLPRFLSIFAAIAQTMAYAHTRGVIHRDLKPSNVMVGSFGEVQVMDWGLAKVLTRAEVTDDAGASKGLTQETLIATARSDSRTDLSHAGSVMGTPSYMAPEQARGEIHRLDERCDVFAMGSILCDILTGAPAYSGKGSKEVLRMAAQGNTADALTRLESRGCDVDLIALAKDCLAVELEDRPRNGNVVAERITSYLAGVQERVQAAERERAVAVAKAIEERRRRKVQLALAASVLALTTLGGLSTTYYLQQQQARAAAGQRVIDQVTTLQGQALARPEDIPRWEVALAAVEQADPAGDPKTKIHLLAMQNEIQAGLDSAKRDKTLLDRLVDILSAAGDDPDGSITEHDYAKAFRDAGIDLANLSPAKAGTLIKARPPSVALAMSGALDYWAAIRRGRQANAAGAARLWEAVNIADPDPWRIKLRAARAQSDKSARSTAFQALAQEANYQELGPVSLALLAYGLKNAGDLTRAESVLRKAQQLYPLDVWINYELGKTLERLSQSDEAIRFYTAARSIRPETAHELAHALERRGDSDEAIAVFRDLKRLRPSDVRHLGCLGEALKHKGLAKEADEILEAAVVAGREVSRLKPDDGSAHQLLGKALAARGELEAAIAEYRTAIQLMPDSAIARSNLGHALMDQSKINEAIAEFRAAIRLKPNDSNVHNSLGNAFYRQARKEESITEYREAIRLMPDYALPHSNLGNALADQGKFDEAVAEYRAVVRLIPNDAEAHSSLGVALNGEGKRDEALAEFRTAIRLKPNYAEAHCNLADILKNQGDYAGALAMFRKGHELGTRRADWRYPSAQWVTDAERLLALANRLPAILRGEQKPKDNVERLGLAQIAYDSRSFAAAARLRAEAMAIDPKLGDARQPQHRYDAACAAALAGSGQGKDDPPPDDASKTKLRRQAFDWLKAELSAWTKVLDSGPPQARPFIAQTLQHWKVDSDLAAIRDPAALAKLSEAERKDWQALWFSVDAMLAKLSSK